MRYTVQIIPLSIELKPNNSLSSNLRKKLCAYRLRYRFSNEDDFRREIWDKSESKMTLSNVEKIGTEEKYHIWRYFLDGGEITEEEFIFSWDKIPCEVLEHYEHARNTGFFTSFCIRGNKNFNFWILLGNSNGNYIIAIWQSRQNNPQINFELIMDWISEGRDLKGNNSCVNKESGMDTVRRYKEKMGS